MRNALLFALFLSLIACGEPTADVADEAPDEAAAEVEAAPEAAEAEAAVEHVGPEVAVFAVPELDGPLARELATALQGIDGVLKAKPVLDSGSLEVTFEPAKVGPDTILTALSGAADGTALKEIKAADAHAAPGHDCGNCPKKSCPRSQRAAEQG
jgi:hypothetical protein